MSYKEKKTLVSILSGILLLVAYCIYVLGKVRIGIATPDDMKFWATAILKFIGIGIAATIIIQIVFHILISITLAVKEQIQTGKCDDKVIEKTLQLEMVEDEMDKLISLKSMRVSLAFSGIGFIVALLSIVLNGSAAVMFNIIFASFIIGTMIEGITQLYFYRRGIKNG